MAEPVSALGGAVFEGFATVSEVGPVGMVTLRGDLGSAKVAAAVRAATGMTVPGVRGIETAGERAVGWMSPDELLLVVPYAEAPKTVTALGESLAGEHHLAVDVSDARAVFRLSGPGAREALAKLCPVDLAPAAFGPGELRRTRAAQVAAAFWMSGPEEFTIVCFRSVARYVFDLLKLSATKGAEVGVF